MQPQPPAWDAKTMSLSAISLETAAPSTRALSDQGAALETCARELRRMLSNGLLTTTFSDWLGYWNEEERWETFADLFRGFRRAVQALPEEARQQRNREAHRILTNGFPDHRQQLEAIVATQADISKMLRDELSLPLRSAEVKAADAECARSFNSAQMWWIIAMNSLLLLAEVNQRSASTGPGGLHSELITFAFETTLDGLHAVCEGKQLRVLSSDTLHLTFHAEISPTDDGLGFLGTCFELDLMTCGETEEEMIQLLADLIRSFVKSEESRGTLGKYVAAHLKAPGEISIGQLVIRLDVLCSDGVHSQFVVIDDLARAA
jgi:hypothetical protein